MVWFYGLADLRLDLQETISRNGVHSDNKLITKIPVT